MVIAVPTAEEVFDNLRTWSGMADALIQLFQTETDPERRISLPYGEKKLVVAPIKTLGNSYFRIANYNGGNYTGYFGVFLSFYSHVDMRKLTYLGEPNEPNADMIAEANNRSDFIHLQVRDIIIQSEEFRYLSGLLSRMPTTSPYANPRRER